MDYLNEESTELYASSLEETEYLAIEKKAIWEKKQLDCTKQ